MHKFINTKTKRVKLKTFSIVYLSGENREKFRIGGTTPEKLLYETFLKYTRINMEPKENISFNEIYEQGKIYRMENIGR